jgi:S-adenosylmethionine:tRNA ribosyltransferase-isomerase
LDSLKTSDFDYYLPPERIAQRPIEPRHASRLLIFNRDSGDIVHTTFYSICDFLKKGDLLVLNKTRVIPARLYARKVPSGGKIELLLLNQQDAYTWETLVGGKRMGVGNCLELENGIKGHIVNTLDGARRLVRFEQKLESVLDEIGKVPLPPYIHETLQDPERYQTVYAEIAGSAAAPTAGLHFTPQLLKKIYHQGIGLAYIVLHVGLDTFAPVNEEDPAQHLIHSEWCHLPAETAQVINHTRQQGGRVIAVGTTSARVLESAARKSMPIKPFEGATDLFILPGYHFKVVDALITNFHLPRSTLLMMVSAFAGREQILDVYKKAIDLEYRFYSFGDAMLIL